MRWAAIPLLLLALPTQAQQPPPVTITLTAQEQTALENTGLACFERTPGQCAEYVMYVRGKISQARQPPPTAEEGVPSAVDPDQAARHAAAQPREQGEK